MLSFPQNGHADGGARLRQLLDGDSIIVAPGVFDGITTRSAIHVGFDCLYMSGAAVTGSRLGLPDLAFVSMDDFVQTADMIANTPGCPPLICDADTGFGSASQIARLVQRYHRAGVAGFHIEDQVQSKRCGHLLGKQLVDTAEYISRIKAAVIGRESIPGSSSIVIIARTDALQSQGFDAALARLKAAVEAGADVAFMEGVASDEQLRTTVKELYPTPVLVNLVVGGTTPHWTTEECQKLGAKIAILPGAALRSVALAAIEAYDFVATNGRDISTEPTSANSKLGLRSPRDFFKLVGLEEAMKIDAAVGNTGLNGV